MKLLFLCVAIWAAVDAKATNTCTAGEWGEWSEWKTAEHDSSGKSWHAEPSLIDTGPQKRAYIMKQKADNQARRLTCREQGLCTNKASQPAYTCTNGLINGVLDCFNIDQQAFMNFADLGSSGAEANDIWGWTDPATSKEYAIMGLTTGTSFVDITDPVNPVFLGFMDGQNGASTWRDMKVVNDYVYIGSEATAHGIQYYDLTGLASHPPGNAIAPTERLQGTGACHNLVSSTGSASIIGVGCGSCSGGLDVYDVSDPLNPSTGSCFSADGYTHDAQCIAYTGPDNDHNGKEICFAFNEDTLTIVDITDKAAMTQISRIAYSGVQYSHQGWVTENQELLLLDDELDEDTDSDKRQRTYIWDVRDLDNPVLMNTYYSTLNSIDHNQYVVGQFTYQSNYQTGLRILHIDEATYTLEERAHFDTYAGTNNAAFNGAWSVYPYFPSGNLIISAIEDGMYIVKASSLTGTAEKEQRYRYRELMTGDIHYCPNLMEVERQ